MSATLPPEETDPVAITNYLLERTREGYLSEDFDLFQSYFALPQVVGNFDGDRRIETVDELRSTYQSILALMKNLGVVDMHRRVIEARFTGPDEIEATSVSEYILAGYKVGEEIVSHSRLSRIDGLWKITESRYATKIAPFNNAIRPAE